MGQLVLITDDPARSAELVSGLGPDLTCRLHDLRTDLPDAESWAERPSVLVADVPYLDTANVRRLRDLVAQARRQVPFIVLLRQDTPHARLQALAAGASQTLNAPFDLSQILGARRAADAGAEPLPFGVERRVEAARQFFGSVFSADRPIVPAIADTGTNIVAQAIQDTGIRDWIRAVRRFDDATHQHCLLVAGLAAAFASSLGLGARERHRLTKAALLHDVGKIHVPAAILNKPGRLDPAEMAVMRLHPAQGEAMLAGQGFEPEMLAVVRSHHEMLDGSGYPDKLCADAIGDPVRLLTICDIYAALIERRPYKAPMTTRDALSILSGMDGKLEGGLVQAFGRVVQGTP